MDGDVRDLPRYGYRLYGCDGPYLWPDSLGVQEFRAGGFDYGADSINHDRHYSWTLADGCGVHGDLDDRHDCAWWHYRAPIYFDR